MAVTHFYSFWHVALGGLPLHFLAPAGMVELQNSLPLWRAKRTDLSGRSALMQRLLEEAGEEAGQQEAGQQEGQEAGPWPGPRCSGGSAGAHKPAGTGV